MIATAKDLRFHTGEILETAMRGEEVVITYRGKPSARILPFRNCGERKRKGRELFGIWRDNEAATNVEEYVAGLRKGRQV